MSRWFAPRGWLFPDLSCCLRCHLSGGDHHACWRDHCNGCRWLDKHAIRLPA